MMLFLLKLIFAHFLGDFVLQPAKWVEHKLQYKAKSKFLYLHVAVHLVALLLLLQLQELWAVAIIVVTHFFIDWGKLALTNQKNERWLFVLDQVLHLLILVLVAYFHEPITLTFTEIFSPQVLLLLTFLAFVTFVSAILIKMLLLRYITDLSNEEAEKGEGGSLKDAGRYIGMLERLFVFGFILLGQWSAIGLLITAKSVFRFGDLNKGNNRKLTEYVLIGTLLSFGLAIAAGLGYQYFYSLLK